MKKCNRYLRSQYPKGYETPWFVVERNACWLSSYRQALSVYVRVLLEIMEMSGKEKGDDHGKNTWN